MCLSASLCIYSRLHTNTCECFTYRAEAINNVNFKYIACNLACFKRREKEYSRQHVQNGNILNSI